MAVQEGRMDQVEVPVTLVQKGNQNPKKSNVTLSYSKIEKIAEEIVRKLCEEFHFDNEEIEVMEQIITEILLKEVGSGK